MKMLASIRQGTKIQVPLETKASTSKSIPAFHAGTCAASTCYHGIDSETTKRAKAEKDREIWL